MWPFRRVHDPKAAVLGTMARLRFSALGPEARIAYANVGTTRVSDLALLCELEQTVQQLFDLADERRRNGRVHDLRFDRRWTTVAHLGGGAGWELGVRGLIAAGARRLIQAGVCGALRDELALGDLVVANAAVVNDDCARAYADVPRIASTGPMFDFVRDEAPSLVGSVPVHFVDAISAPSFFQQPEAELRAWSERAAVVDLEVATTAAMARHHGCEWLAVFVVADRKLTGEDLFHLPAYPMATLFDHGALMLRALATGIRRFNAPA